MSMRPSLRAVTVRESMRLVLAVARRLNRGSTRRLRTEFDIMTRLMPNPPGLRVEHTMLGGIPSDVLIPSTARSDGAMMYIHGGGYTIGSPRTHRAMVGRLSLQARMKVYLPDYRLAPEHPYPAALDDVASAWADLQNREQRLVLAGESAGGGLSVALCHKALSTGMRVPEKMYLQSPWLDLALEQASYRARNRKDPMLKTRWLGSQFSRLYAAGQDLHHPGISPFYGTANGFPPTLIQVGTHETLHDEALGWSEKLRAAGVPVHLHIGPGLWHAWPFLAPLVPEATDALRQAGEWLRFSN